MDIKRFIFFIIVVVIILLTSCIIKQLNIGITIKNPAISNSEIGDSLITSTNTTNIPISTAGTTNISATTTTKIETDITRKKGDNMENLLGTWGNYGTLIESFKICIIPIGIVILFILLLTWLLPKYLPHIFVFIPKMLRALLISALIFGVRYLLINWIFHRPVGELVLDSIFASILAHFIYGAFLKKKLFISDTPVMIVNNKTTMN